MLKLPKGLKKKKKGKKSKKDQELFTEEELEQYKREHQLKQLQGTEPVPTASTVEIKSNVEDNLATACAIPVEPPTETKGEQDEEWSKFKALTAGVDSILHRTQDDLDRIKSTSFYQRVPTTAEKEKLVKEEAAARAAEKQEQERLKKLEEEANRDKLAEAVVELSESEEESEEVDDIFNTEYIDAITSGEIQFTIVPDSPILESENGPDPFDTAYADILIKGPELSSRGKKLVSIGSAVEVLTGRVDSAHAVALSGAKRKPRKGIQNLLLENEEDAALVSEEFPVTPEPAKTLLDDFDEDIPDLPIDLSVSLHLPLLKQKQEQEVEEKHLELEDNQINTKQVVLEFDVLRDDEDDEFAELAVESLTKKEEIKVLTNHQFAYLSQTVDANWAEFESTDNEQESNNTQIKVKPPRPPPARPVAGPQIGVVLQGGEGECNFEITEDDPFDTAFVEKVIQVKTDDDDDDFDFDPRAGENQSTNNSSLSAQKDLLGDSSTNISSLGQAPLQPVQDNLEETDPFDTSTIANLVQPKETELKFIEKELLADQNLHKSLSDPDFDPRGDENLPQTPVVNTDHFDSARRKSSLSLNLHSKSVGFLIPETDVFALDNETGKIQKPLTPYYVKSEAIEEKKEIEDPFDTSFVADAKLSDTELKHIESDLLNNSNLKRSLSDPDFDPRADDCIVKPQSDLLAVENNINIKVLTPAQEKKLFATEIVDPFDTSIASNIKPGKTELKLLENELLPPSTSEITTGVLDSLSDAQELGLGDKVLTPQLSIISIDSIEEVDPFDTSFASNLRPGKTEIKILENELIEH